MKSSEILERYLSFMKKNGHAQVPNISLVPEGDSTLLFVNSGMFPLVPYLSGEEHPLGTRLTNVQRALRFDDLEDVGDNRHTTAFHMIGNWSLADYFKEEQLNWIFQLCIEEWGLDINRMYSTVFEGDEYAPKDEESIKIIKSIFAKYGVEAEEGERIFAYDKEENWWQRGDAIGELGGPDSELFYYIGEDGTGLGQNPADNQDDFIEIGNSVFMQYKKTENGWEELPQKNVDFGGGLERIAMMIQGKRDIFETDNFWPIIEEVEKVSGRSYRQDEEVTSAMRAIADHMRAATFLAMDGVTPSNKDQGYVLRRYLRLIVRLGKRLSFVDSVSPRLVPIIADTFEWLYPQLQEKKESIMQLFEEEERKFATTLEKAQKQVDRKIGDFGGSAKEAAEMAFDLFQSLGFPREMFLEELSTRGHDLSQEEFDTAYDLLQQSHQELSRKGAEQKFKGGLADNSEQVLRYHTATHLLNGALREVLGNHIMQRGSNITGERLRFDFNHDEALTEQQLKEVQSIINKKVAESLPVQFEMMPVEEAEKTGAIHAFGDKYGETVKVYFIGENMENAWSKEFCGGPHVENTSEIGEIEVYKQQSVGKGLRRVYARSIST